MESNNFHCSPDEPHSLSVSNQEESVKDRIVSMKRHLNAPPILQRSDPDLFDYVSGKIADDKLFEFDQRMAENPSLLQDVQALFFLKENFNEFWETLSVDAISMSMQHRAILQATVSLTEKCSNQPELLPRLVAAVAQAFESSRSGFRMLMNHAKGFVGLTGRDEDHGWESRLQLNFGGIGSPDSELQDCLEKAHDALSSGAISESAERLENALLLDRDHPAVAMVQSMDGSRVVAELESDAARQYLGIRIFKRDSGNEPLKAILVSDSDPCQVDMGDFEWEKDEGVWIAEFFQVRDGAYRILALE